MSSEEYHEEDEGIHFDPTIEELINDYFKRKVDGEDCGDFIVEKDVYAKEPWLLEHTKNTFFKENEWYYFSQREQISEKKIDHGKYSKRKIGGDDGIDRGNWSANWRKYLVEAGNIIGELRNLTYKRDKNKKKQKRGDGAAASAINVAGSQSRWIMDEYVLVDPKDPNKFQKLVLCKIHEIKKDSKNDASTSTHRQGSSYSLEHQPINEAHEFDEAAQPALSEMFSYVDQQQTSTSIHHHDEASTSSTQHYWFMNELEFVNEASTSNHNPEEASTSSTHRLEEASTWSTHHHQPINEAEEVAELDVLKDFRYCTKKFLF